MGRKKVQYELSNIGNVITQIDDFTGNVYKRKGSVSTVETPEKVIKSARSFETVERAERAHQAFKDLGLSGAPSSPSTVFRKVLAHHIDEGDVPHPWRARPDDFGFDSSGACWLWIERAVPKDIEISGPVHHYDINQAFWSATKEGLPIRFFPYDRRDEDYVARVVIKDAEKDLPHFYQKSLTRNRECLITGKDVRHFGLEVEIKDAVSYVDDYVDYTPVYNTISKHFGPWVAKRARQQSWGTFVMKHGGVRGVRYEDGNTEKTWTMKNRFQNRLWGIIITRRIIRKVHRALTENGGVSCFVDSVLSMGKVETENAPGSWRKEGKYDNGIYIKTPGIWDTLPRSTKRPSSKWKKHSGIKPAPSTEADRKITIRSDKKSYDPKNTSSQKTEEKQPMPKPYGKMPWDSGIHPYDSKPGITSGLLVPEDDPLSPSESLKNRTALRRAIACE